MRRRTSLIFRIAVVSALLGLATVGACQGIENYALAHPFGLSSATTTRQSGMGGPVSCIWDQGFANPAFAATQTSRSAAVRVSSTGFDRGPDLVSTHIHYVYPLRENVSGLQLTLFSLRANAAVVPMPGIGAGVVDLFEEDISIQYGHRLNPRLTAGIGVSPYSKLGFTLGAPGGGALMDTEAESDIGARIGLAYEWFEGDYLGLVYDHYQETATAVGAMVPGGARRVFHSDLLALGASYHVTPEWLVVAEYQRASTNDGPMTNSLIGWHLGTEYRPSPTCGLRAGLNDEHLTLGLGWSDDRWQCDYAFMNRWNDDIAAGLFGGSNTHQLQLIGRW